VRREFGIHRDVADLGDARLAVLEHGAARMPGHVLGIHDDADEALVIPRGVLALDLLHRDAALARDHGGRHHVDVLQEGAQHAGDGRGGERARVHVGHRAFVLDADAPDGGFRELAEEGA